MSPKLRYLCKILGEALYGAANSSGKLLVFATWPIEQWLDGGARKRSPENRKWTQTKSCEYRRPLGRRATASGFECGKAAQKQRRKPSIFVAGSQVLRLLRGISSMATLETGDAMARIASL
jgi:hypothetical protein